MPGEITIKVEGQGEIRRFRLAEERAVYAEVHRLIAEAWPGKGAHQATYTEELGGPTRSLCEASFPELLVLVARRASQSGGPKVLKLKLQSLAKEEPFKVEKKDQTSQGAEAVEFGGPGGVFKKFRCLVRALKESDALTPLALSALVVNWLPSLLSCLEQSSGLPHVDHLENTVLPGAPSVFESLRLAAMKTPELQCFVGKIRAFIQQTTEKPNETKVGSYPRSAKGEVEDEKEKREDEQEGGQEEGTQENKEREYSKVRSVWPLRDLVGEELLVFWQAMAKLPFETQMRVVKAAAKPSVSLLKNLYLAKPPELGKVWCASWCPPWAGIPPGAMRQSCW